MGGTKGGYSMTLGEKIAEKRRARGMTQEELAEKLGVTAQAVSKWENNNSYPDITLLPTIASLFETTIDALMSRERSDVVSYVPEKTRRSIDDMVLHISVLSDDTKVNVNLPLAIVKALVAKPGQESILKFGNTDLSGVDFEAIIQMVEAGLVGRIVEVEQDDGTRIVVEVM